MTNLIDLSSSQLRRLITLKEKIESLQSELASLTGGADETNGAVAGIKRRKMSAAARARIAAGARARWARVKGKTPATAAKPAKKKDGRSSPAVRAKLAAAARARWKKAKAAGKSVL